MIRSCAMVLIGACLFTSGCGKRAKAPDEVGPTTPQTQPPQPSVVAPAPVSPTSEVLPRTAEVAPEPTRQPPAGLREIFPLVRVDVAQRLVEFDAWVPINPKDPNTPVVYLEQIACIADTKEHESLLVTSARPSHIHAAMLLIGLQPGKPGEYDWTGPNLKAIPPQGDRVMVRCLVGEDQTEIDPTVWAVSQTSGKTLAQTNPNAGFVFAGSIDSTGKGKGENEAITYDADGSGTLIGLTTFGTECVAWSDMYSHDSGVEDPQWIADSKTTPPFGTKVRVRIRPNR